MMSMQEPEEVFDVPAEEDLGSGKVPAGSGPDDLRILEAVLFASDELLTAAHLKTILPSQPDARKIRSMVEKINAQLQKERHPFEIVEIGGGYQFRTITYYHPWVRQIFKEKANKKLSIQALECLAIIAYKQPLSKAEIEAIRGVVSDGAMKTLLEKRLVTIAGRSDKPGRPLLYGTTPTFLKYFGLNRIEDLPRIEEFEAMAREKMEDLTIDELNEVENTTEKEDATVDEQGEPGVADTSVETPVKSSLFELDLTSDATQEKSDTNNAVDNSTHGNEEPVDFEMEVKTEKQGEVTTTEDEIAATPVKIEEEVVDLPLKASGKESTTDPEVAMAEKTTTGVSSATGKTEKIDVPAAVDGAALKGETAFDFEAIILQNPTSPAPVIVDKKEKKVILDAEALRGETAFDLEAIIIDDPVIPMAALAAGNKASVVVDKATSADDATFERAEAPDESSPAAAAETEEAFEIKETASEKEAVIDFDAALEEVPPAAAPVIIDEAEEAFEIKGPVPEKGAAIDLEASFEKATTAVVDEAEEALEMKKQRAKKKLAVKPTVLFEEKAVAPEEKNADEDEEGALFEPTSGSTTPKSSETAYFEVGLEDTNETDGSSADHEKLAEALKETVAIVPVGYKKTASLKSGGGTRKTTGKKPVQKKDAETGNAAEATSGEKSPVRSTRTRRKSGSDTGAA